MSDRLALLAPVPPGLITDAFPDLEVVVVRGGRDAAARVEGARVAVADWSAAGGPSAEGAPDTVVIDEQLAAALAPTCELVQVPAAGLDSVDVAACRAAGIPVASCRGLNTAAVAEWIVWAAIDGLRGLSHSDRAVRNGGWPQLSETRMELAGRTVGIVGLGAVGTAAATRLAAFDVTLAYWSRRRREPTEERRLGVEHRELDALIADSDVLVVTVALTPDTRGLLSAARIRTMLSGAVVVNAARGGVVDETALARAVADGRLHAVVTDVLTVEPPPADHPLLDREAVTVTPHIAGSSDEAVGRILDRVLDNIARVLDGRRPTGLVTPAG